MDMFDYASTIKNQLLHHLVCTNQVNQQLAERIGAEFNNSRQGFSDLVSNLCRTRNTQPTEDIIVEATQIALDQLWKSMTTTQVPNYGANQMSTGMVGAPNYGSGYNVGNPFQTNQPKQPASISLQGSNTPKIVFEPRTNQPIIQNTIAPKPSKPITPIAVEEEYKKELNTQTVNKGASIRIMNLNDDAVDTNYNRKIRLKVEGSTRKVASGLFNIERVVIEVNEEGELDWVQFDNIKFFNKLIFDSGYDMFQFINSNLSRGDVDIPYVRVVSYDELVPITFPFNDFKEEYDKIVEYMKTTYETKDDLLARWEELKEHLNILENMVKRDIFKIIEDFLVDEINKHLKKVMRFKSNINYQVSIEHLKDIEQLLFDKNLDKLRDNSKFEQIMNYVLGLIMDFLMDKGALRFLDIEEPANFDHYVRSRKLMDIENVMNAFTSDYYKYPDNVNIQNNLIDKMKERVVMVAPRRTIITNVFSPNFIRQAMMTMVQKPFSVPKIDTNSIDNVDNLIYLILHKITTNDVNAPIPNQLFYVFNNKNDYKELSVGFTIEGDIIIN